MATAVIPGTDRLNPQFAQMAKHYGADVAICPPHRPQRKGVVEAAIKYIGRRPGLSNAQLARRSMITPQSMNGVVAELERRGLVDRRVDPTHGRILQMRLTPAGRGMLRRTTPIVEALQTELLQDVPADDREIVVRGLESAMQRLSGVESSQ